MFDQRIECLLALQNPPNYVLAVGVVMEGKAFHCNFYNKPNTELFLNEKVTF